MLSISENIVLVSVSVMRAYNQSYLRDSFKLGAEEWSRL